MSEMSEMSEMSDFSVIVPNFSNQQTTTKEDILLWECAVYEFWDVSDIFNDLFDRIHKMKENNYDTTIRYVFEGIRAIRDKEKNCETVCKEIISHLKIRETLLKNETKLIEKREEIADKIIQLQIDIETSQLLLEEGVKEGTIISLHEINMRKIDITKEMKRFEQSGANNEDMKILGKLLKGVSLELETLLKMMRR
jgi:hypothetical protein